MIDKRGLICLGNPVVDAYALASDEFLEKYEIPKGSAPIFPAEKVKSIISHLNFSSECFAGSGANVTKGLGLMGCKTALIGQYSDDENGKIIKESLKRHNIRDLSCIKKGYTTRINTFITPDKQRTMLAIFGVSHESREEEFDLSIMDEYEYFLIEGYHFCNKHLLDLSEKCTNYADKIGMKIVLILSNIFCVESFKKEIQPVADKSYIISGNEEEFLKMFNKSNLEELLEHLEKNESKRIMIVTLGEKGAYITYNGQRFFINAPEVKELKDTTGAGDLFTSGFLYGFLNKYKITTCAKIANIFAKHIISKIGTDLPPTIKQEVIKFLEHEKK